MPAEPSSESGASEVHPAQKWPESFWILEWVELTLVCCIGVLVLGLAVYLGLFWIPCACFPEVHTRLVETVRGLNVGWKVGLLVLIPLFFRPVFKFLFYLRKGPFGSESHSPEIGEMRGQYGPGQSAGEK